MSSFESGKSTIIGTKPLSSQHSYAPVNTFRPPTSESSSSSSTFQNVWKERELTNIWGAGFPSTSTTRQTPASRPSLNFGSANGKQPGKETIEGKMGSGQLVESSISDDSEFRAHFAKRDEGMRSFGNAVLPQAYPGAARQPSSFSSSSRPTTATLNTASNNKAHFAANFDSPLSYTNEAPQVYTKLDRSAKQPIDSAYGEWADNSLTHSPVAEQRRPSVQGPGTGTGTGTGSGSGSGYFSLPSAPQSRNGSLPPSRHGDQPSSNFLRNTSFSSATRPTAASFAPVDLQPNPLPQFSHMNFQSDSQSLASQRPSFAASSLPNQPPSTYPRNHIADQSDDVEEVERPPLNPFVTGAYVSSQPPPDYMLHRASQTLNGNLYNSRSSPPFQRPFDPIYAFHAPADFPPVAHSAVLDQKLRIIQETNHHNAMMQMHLHLPYGQFNGNFYPGFRLANGAPPHSFASIPPGIGLSTVPYVDVPKGPRELDGHSLRSALLEEFKNNNKTRRYDLKDIYDHVVEFSGDQHGSRFIQQKLETANSDEKEHIFRELQSNAVQLMTDVFGNYVIQKFFEHGDQNQKKIFANKMKGRVLDLSVQMYGCRVVQKALEHILTDQQAILVRELERDVLRCVKDQNGNHVIQKAIERCQAKDIGFIFQSFTGQIQHLSVHTYGCRVIQRCLEHCEPATKKAILSELHDCMPTLIGDSFGNYVAQHVVAYGFEADQKRVLDLVLQGLEGYSKHKFASNVVEKCLLHSDDTWKRQVIEVLVPNDRRDGESILVGLIRDNFGNYVVQKLLELLNDIDYLNFVEILQPEMTRAKRTGCGKQVIQIEKRMSRSVFGQHSHGRLPFDSRNDSNNTTPPPLTADCRSLQTSSAASINGDTLEGAAASRKGSVQHSEPTVFEA